MKTIKKKFITGAGIALFSLSSLFTQNCTAQTDTAEQKSNGKLMRRSMVWGMTSTNFKQDPVTNIISANVFKHSKSKGFGIMGLLVTQPSNLNQNEKPFVPLASTLLHWGNKHGNINVGPVTHFNGGKLIDGYRGIINLNGKPIGLRGIFDYNAEGQFKNLGLFGRYHVANNIEATAGILSSKTGNASIMTGLSVSF